MSDVEKRSAHLSVSVLASCLRAESTFHIRMVVHNSSGKDLKRSQTAILRRIAITMLADVSANYTEWFPLCSLKRTVDVLNRRVEAEGLDFLTKSLPSLRKELDRALTGSQAINCLRFQKKRDTELPLFLGEFFERVFLKTGWIQPDPCVVSVRTLRQVLDLFYKYKLPYDKNTEEQTIRDFQEADATLDTPRYNEESAGKPATSSPCHWSFGRSLFGFSPASRRRTDHLLWERTIRCVNPRRGSVLAQNAIPGFCSVCSAVSQQWSRWSNGCYRAIECSDASAVKPVAKRLLSELLCNFDPLDIVPRHGPGSVSTGEKAWEKMAFKRYYTGLGAVYPYDTYFFVSPTHLVDEMSMLGGLIELTEGQAKVVLVPKDSRGPRIISEEPCELQYVQQGLRRALYRHVEVHSLTRHLVNFTDQTINRALSLRGSHDGSIATLDLKEASDRVSLSLVRELFPEHVVRALVATRSATTQLPSGEVLRLKKFAPMGSALCFPIMALTIWSVVTAALLLKDGRTRSKERPLVYVYGDDVIVLKQNASDAINALHRVGLRVNTAKCFVDGSFRESCGLDAFRGVEVTPVRIKSLWVSYHDASTYASWIAYANSFWRIGYRQTAQLIAEMLKEVYGPIPAIPGLYWGYEDLQKYRDKDIFGYPHLSFSSDVTSGVLRRWDRNVQRYKHLVFTIKPTQAKLGPGRYNGWSELLRYLNQGGEEFTAGVYANRRTSRLVRRWR